MDNRAVIGRLNQRMKELEISPSAVSKIATGSPDTIRNWLRSQEAGKQFTMDHKNLESVARAVGVTLSWLVNGHDGGDAHLKGLAEETSAYVPKASESNAAKSLFSNVSRHPQIGCRVQVPMPGLGLAVGDLLVMDLGREAVTGELVLVTVTEDNGQDRTVVRRIFPPYLLAHTMDMDDPPMNMDGPGVTVRYPVVGLIRGLAP